MRLTAVRVKPLNGSVLQSLSRRQGLHGVVVGGVSHSVVFVIVELTFMSTRCKIINMCCIINELLFLFNESQTRAGFECQEKI